MIALVDYGAGNLASVSRALDFLELEYRVATDPPAVQESDSVILPGVGSFGSAMQTLGDRGLVGAIKEAIHDGRPFLGVCLGLQLLFDRSEEAPGVDGFGLCSGEVVKFSGEVRVPHIGWNQTEMTDSPLFYNVDPGSYFYYVHSYFVRPDRAEDTSAACEYGERFCAAVSRDNVHAVQFHPEKSQDAGLQVLRNFVERC